MEARTVRARLVSSSVVFVDLPLSLVVCIHGLVAVLFCWIDAIHGVPCGEKKKTRQKSVAIYKTYHYFGFL